MANFRKIPEKAEVWIVSISSKDEIDRGFLCYEEDQRLYDRIRLKHKKRNFAFRRYVRKYILQQYIPHYSLHKDVNGRPYLLDLQGKQSLYFSCSSSNNLCVVGVSRSKIGIDIEIVDRKIDIVAICNRFFPTFLSLKDYGIHQSWLMWHAFSIWCLAESFGKLTGISLHAILADQNKKITQQLKRRQNNDSLIYGKNFVCAVSQENQEHIDVVNQFTFSQLKQGISFANY